MYGDAWSPLVQTSPGLNQINDTMTDIIIDTSSAFIMNVMLYIYFRFWIFTFFETYELILKEKRKVFVRKVKKTIEAIKETVEDIEKR